MTAPSKAFAPAAEAATQTAAAEAATAEEAVGAAKYIIIITIIIYIL